MSPVWQSEGKVKLLFMTFKMAQGRQVGLYIKFIWNLHFDWPTVWANSTVTYWSDRDFWQLWTIAEMAFKTQTVRAGEVFPVSHLICLLSAAPPPPPPASRWLSVKQMESYFQRCKMRILLGSPSVASALGYPFASSHPWLHLPALFLLVKSTVGLGPACLRAMEVISVSLGYQPGTFLQCALTSATQLQMLTQESSWFLSSCLKHNLSSKYFFILPNQYDLLQYVSVSIISHLPYLSWIAVV